MKRIKYWFIRLWFAKIVGNAFKVDIPFHKHKVAGDLIIGAGNDVEYIGGGYYIALTKEESTKFSRGGRINNFLRSAGTAKNQFIIRDGKQLSARVDRKESKSRRRAIIKSLRKNKK